MTWSELEMITYTLFLLFVLEAESTFLLRQEQRQAELEETLLIYLI